MSDVTRVRQPTKRPTTFDEHIPGSVSGNLKDRIELSTGVAVRENVTCAGAARLRVRFLATCAGQLKLRFMRSITNHDIEYPTEQPSDVGVVADTEAIINVELHYGEGRAYIEFVPSGNGVLTYCDLLMT